MKIAIVGAGSTYTPELIEGIIDRAAALDPTELYLMDIDARKLRIVGGLAQRMVEAAGLKCTVVLTDDLDASLKGASFVLGQVRVGKLPAREKDETIPLKYGLLGQETMGIGGFFKGQRTIPVLLNVAHRMEALCPDAWLINFSNPSGMVAQALNDHSDIRSIGLCNVPFNMMKSLKKQFGLENPSFEFVGLNHLSWVTAIRENGHDYLQEALRDGVDTDTQRNIPAAGFSTDLIRAVKAIPSGYLEYVYYINSKVEKLQEKLANGEKCRAQVCMDIEEDLLALYSDSALHVKPELLNSRGGANYSLCAISLVDAIHNDKKEVHVLNTANRGALDFMAPGDVVEIATVVGKDGPDPIPVENFTNRHIISTTQQFKTYEHLAVQAAVTGDRDAAMLALMANPLIFDYNVAKACMDEMLEAHRDFLPQYFR